MAFDQAATSDAHVCEEKERRLAAVKLCVSEGHGLDVAARRLRLTTSALRKWLRTASPDYYAQIARPRLMADDWTEAQLEHLKALHKKQFSYAEMAKAMNAKFDMVLTREHVRHRLLKLGQLTKTPSNRPCGAWSDATVERLKTLSAEGYSAAQIARQLNVEFGVKLSRSAVIGKVGRLGLALGGSAKRTPPSAPRRPATGKAKAARTNRRKLVTPAPTPPLPPAEPSQAGLFDPVSLMDLQSHHCRWPVSIDGPDPAESRLEQFCGAPKTSLAYCAGHAARAYRPAGDM